MAITLWKNSDGKLIKNEKGQLIKCDRCPCVEDDCYIRASASCAKVLDWGGDYGIVTEPVACTVTPTEKAVTCLDNVGDKISLTVNVTTEVKAICTNILIEYHHYMGNGKYETHYGEGADWTERTSFTFTVIITRTSDKYIDIDI